MPAIISEADEQRTIVDYFEIVERCKVFATNAAVRKVAASFGVPDLLIWHPAFPPGCLFGLELKRPEIVSGGKVVQRKGRPTKQQRECRDMGVYPIASCLDEARTHYQSFCRSLKVGI